MNEISVLLFAAAGVVFVAVSIPFARDVWTHFKKDSDTKEG